MGPAARVTWQLALGGEECLILQCLLHVGAAGSHPDEQGLKYSPTSLRFGCKYCQSPSVIGYVYTALMLSKLAELQAVKKSHFCWCLHEKC